VGDTTTLYAVGHGTLSEVETTELLHQAGIAHVVDIRSYPGSRRNPQFGHDQLERWLPAAGIGYSWDRRLGGRRRPDPSSPNVALRHEAFRAYADHMATAEFAEGLDALIGLAAATPSAVMCAETLWWRCHRRLIAELLQARGHEVVHLLRPGHSEPHRPWEPISETRAGRLYLCGELVA
jgi:uncharacterized protein (DUF488 family)